VRVRQRREGKEGTVPRHCCRGTGVVVHPKHRQRRLGSNGVVEGGVPSLGIG